MSSDRKQPEPDRTRREPGELVGKPEDPGAPAADEGYVPGKARLEDDDEELTSHSDDTPGVE